MNYFKRHEWIKWQNEWFKNSINEWNELCSKWTMNNIEKRWWMKERLKWDNWFNG